MGYEKAAGSNPRVYFANGMDNTREDAWATAGKLGELLGRDVGLVVNGTAGSGTAMASAMFTNTLAASAASAAITSVVSQILTQVIMTGGVEFNNYFFKQAAISE